MNLPIRMQVRTRLRRFAIAAFIAALMAPALRPGTLAAVGPLDGKRFAGQTGEVGKDKGDKEEFVFKDGTFDPLSCHQYGFSAAPYTASGEGKMVSFAAETKSAKEGVMKWTGTVQGDELKGTAVWIKDGREIHYWFKAALQSGRETPPPPPPRKDADPVPNPGP